jgi:hypothetical protein
MRHAALLLALSTLRWGPRTLAELLLVNERTVRRWIAGTAVCPDAIVAWLEDLARYHETHPPPEAE